MKHKEQYLNGTHLNTLNRLYKEALNVPWGEVRPHVLIEYTSFKGIDRLSYGRNGVSDVVQLVTQTIEATNLYWCKSRYGTASLYINAATHAYHGFGSQDRRVLFIYRDSKGRKNTVNLQKTWDADKFEDTDRLCHSISFNPAKIQGKPYAVRRRWDLRVQYSLRRMFYSEMRDLERGIISEEIVKTLKYLGITVIKVVPFTHEFSMFGVQYIKNKGLNVEIGQMNRDTYNALPSTLKVTVRKSELKLLKLSQLKIEQAGYYSHHDQMKIRPEHLKQVKAFQSKFKNNSRGA